MIRLALFLLCCGVLTSLAMRLSGCALVYELRRQGFTEYLIKDLVCLIGESSSFRTHVVGGPNKDGSYNYGLFQINDQQWCSSGLHPGKGCNVRCSDLVTDDITVASACVKTILRQQGFSAWPSWVYFCRGYRLPDNNCQ